MDMASGPLWWDPKGMMGSDLFEDIGVSVSLFFYPEDEDSRFLWNVGNYLQNTRRHISENSSFHSHYRENYIF
jgi:hypothetical protein